MLEFSISSAPSSNTGPFQRHSNLAVAIRINQQRLVAVAPFERLHELTHPVCFVVLFDRSKLIDSCSEIFFGLKFSRIGGAGFSGPIAALNESRKIFSSWKMIGNSLHNP